MTGGSTSATVSLTLSEAVTAAVEALPLPHLEALAAAAESVEGPGPEGTRRLADAVPHDGYRPVARRVALAWADHASKGVALNGAALAVAIRIAAATAARIRAHQQLEIVWTGPWTKEVPTRLTAQVIAELAALSVQRLWVVSFAAYKVPQVVEALAAAASRGVDVRLVLETKDDSLGAIKFDASTAFAKIAPLVSLYIWPYDRRPLVGDSHAAMHAKAVIADDVAAFVTSANLTGAALSENMELGLLVRGGPVPRRLSAHYQALVDTDELRRVSPSS